MGRVVVIGAGRQGVAAAYDLAVNASVDRLVLADSSWDAARLGAARVEILARGGSCEPAAVDAGDLEGVAEFLTRFDLAVAAAPYRLNPVVSNAGIQVGCHVVDMGVDTPDALALLEQADEARARGISVVTDCGVAPGIVNVMATALLESHADATSVRLYCGGLPVKAEPPFFHKVGFSVDSLLGEYTDDVDSLRDGAVVRTEPLQGLETLEFPTLGKLEAMTTSGGTGTAPYHLAGRVRDYEYKTLRHPKHWEAMVHMRDAGAWSLKPRTDGTIPRNDAIERMTKAMVDRDAHDVVVARVVVEGPSGTASLDLVDRFDTKTGLSAMQRTTGFSTSIVAIEVLEGRVSPGCMACEQAVSPDRFFAELERRGIHIASS